MSVDLDYAVAFRLRILSNRVPGRPVAIFAIANPEILLAARVSSPADSVIVRGDAFQIPYIHGDRMYELRLLSSTRLARFERDGRTFTNVIRGQFETGEAGKRSGTRFELVYGASGELAGVPILISYQPKWWLQVDLVLNS